MIFFKFMTGSSLSCLLLQKLPKFIYVATPAIWYDIRYILLTAIGLTPGGSSAVQYTFTHKQYTEQHNETEYTEQNIHNNKNT